MESVNMMSVSAWRLARHDAGGAAMTVVERVVRIPWINVALGRLRFAGWWLTYYRGLWRMGGRIGSRVRARVGGRPCAAETYLYARTRSGA